MLGANVGTTLIVQVLSFDISRVAPLFVLIGVILFRKGTQSRPRDLGRVMIGLGLMLFALVRLLAIMTPYEDVPSLRLLMGAIATQPLIDLILGAALTSASSRPPLPSMTRSPSSGSMSAKPTARNGPSCSA
jgi:phosphate:Na+ symporter